MKQLRSVISLAIIVASIAGCSDLKRNTETHCPKFEVPTSDPSPEPKATKPPEPSEFSVTTYRLDRRRILEIWNSNCNKPGRLVFLQDGRAIRTEQLETEKQPGTEATLETGTEKRTTTVQPEAEQPPTEQFGSNYAVCLFPEVCTIPGSPSVHLAGSEALFVVVCQNISDNSWHRVYRVTNGVPRVAKFRARSQLNLEKVNSKYFQLSGIDHLPVFGAQQCDPSVILELADNTLRLNRRAMHKFLPSHRERSEALTNIHSRFKEKYDIPVELFDYVFAYYYCGEKAEARRFFEAAYPKRVSEKKFWWHFVKEQIAQSPYTKRIAK